jgi:hypothetical protein
MIGDSHQFLVAASKPWNASGLLVIPAETYFMAVIETNDWGGAKIATTPNDYDHWDLTSVESALRAPNQKWFCLIGTIAPALDYFFPIGTGLNRFAPTSAGELYCFANNVTGLYANNHGQLTLRVTRIQ